MVAPEVPVVAKALSLLLGRAEVQRKQGRLKGGRVRQRAHAGGVELGDRHDHQVVDLLRRFLGFGQNCALACARRERVLWHLTRTCLQCERLSGQVVVVPNAQRDQHEQPDREQGNPGTCGELRDPAVMKTIAERRQPVALKNRLLRQWASRRRHQWTTIPACDSVKARKTPTANKGIKGSVWPPKAT